MPEELPSVEEAQKFTVLDTELKIASTDIVYITGAIGHRKSSLQEFEKIQDKIAELSQKLRNLEGFEDVQKRFSEAERRYLELQNAIQKDRTKIASLWSSLSLVKGDGQTIEAQIQKLDNCSLKNA